MSDKRTVKNISRQRVALPGPGLLEPTQTAEDIEYSDTVRELEEYGVLHVKQKPQRSERAQTPPTTEE